MSKMDTGKLFDIQRGEVALCDYSHPPDIACRRTKTVGEVSDGRATFDELHSHVIGLFTALAYSIRRDEDIYDPPSVWRSRVHSGGQAIEGLFILGIGTKPGEQITYHLPIDRWDDCNFAETLDRAPEFDGHTSADVLERLKRL